jgi:hypothetical protein
MEEEGKTSKGQYPILLTSLSSFFSGGIARCFVHPLDTVKAKIQVQQMGKNGGLSLFQAIRFTLKNEGFSGLYKGLSVAVFGSLPATCLYFTTYELAKSALLDKASPFLVYLISGVAAEAVSCLFFVPVDVIKERLQVQENLKLYKYEGGRDAFKTIMKNEGLRGIYKAYGATVGSFGPFSALYFLFYEKLKEFCVGEQKEIGFLASLTCASTSGALASFLTNPLDIAKVRMQVVRATGNSLFPYKNMLHGIQLIYTNEGFKALFQGSLARILFHTPNTAIVMSLMEYIRLNLIERS